MSFRHLIPLSGEAKDNAPPERGRVARGGYRFLTENTIKFNHK